MALGGLGHMGLAVAMTRLAAGSVDLRARITLHTVCRVQHARDLGVIVAFLAGFILGGRAEAARYGCVLRAGPNGCEHQPANP